MFYTKVNENTFLFEGKTNLKDFYKVLELDDTDDFEESRGESETIAGFILEIHGKFPRKNQTITFSNYSFKIEQMDKKRIKQVKITIKR